MHASLNRDLYALMSVYILSLHTQTVHRNYFYYYYYDYNYCTIAEVKLLLATTTASPLDGDCARHQRQNLSFRALHARQSATVHSA